MNRRNRLIWEEAFTRVALIIATHHGERGRVERPTKDEVINATMAMYNTLDWHDYQRRYYAGAPLS